jgi:arsenate reductase
MAVGSVRIYHNARCSKSRAALALLTGKGVTPEVVHYLVTPPSADELTGLLDMLGMQPRELIRREESEYNELGLEDPGLTHDQLITAMVMHPKLIQRPIVVADGRAVICRPPERLLALL